jgi:predicted ATPase
MRLESLKLKNFKAFRDAEMRNIPRLCVIVGANGVGKSTLFKVFAFLKDAMESNIRTALAKHGGGRGFEEVRSRGASGNIEIELKFRVSDDKPLITYSLSLGCENGIPFVAKEILSYRRGPHGKPWRFLSFEKGHGFAITNELDDVVDEKDYKRDFQQLKSNDILAIKGLAQFERFPAVVALGDMIENWHISDFHINEARKEQDSSYAEHLSASGDNLANVTQHLHANHPEILKRICVAMGNRVPGIEKVEPVTTEEGKVLLKFKDASFPEPFFARYVSDGTMKMFAYLVLLYDPSPHPLLCIEEPENQLYPSLLKELMEEFRLYARKGGQVFVSTHSPDLLNAAELAEVFYLVKESGRTSIKRASDDPQIESFVKAGDRMGYLWKEGSITGVDPK